MEHPTVFPTLSYDDAQAAIDFLIDAFGAERYAVYAGDDGTIRHAELRFGNGIVMFGSARAEAPATRGRGGGVYVVVDDADAQAGTVAVGSRVTIEDERGEQMDVEISSVGGVSPDSPVGRALMGRKVGDEVDVEAPRGAWRARILAVE